MEQEPCAGHQREINDRFSMIRGTGPQKRNLLLLEEPRGTMGETPGRLTQVSTQAP